MWWAWWPLLPRDTFGYIGATSLASILQCALDRCLGHGPSVHQPHFRVSGASLQSVKPYVQPQVPLQRYGDKQRRLRFAAEQKERDWRCCVFADEKTFVCDPRPNRRKRRHLD